MYAHFFSYLALGILVAAGLRSSGVNVYRLIGLARVICLLFAISDEVHQLFVPGRGGQVRDVVIKVSGHWLGVWG